MPPNAVLGVPVTGAPHQQRLVAVGGVEQAPGTWLTVMVVRPLRNRAVACNVGLFGCFWPTYISCASLSGAKVLLETSTSSQVRPTLICARVGGQTALGSVALNGAGTVKVLLRLPSAPVVAEPIAAASTSPRLALAGLTMAASPLASTSRMPEPAGKLPAVQEIVIIEPGLTPSTAFALAGVAALL